MSFLNDRSEQGDEPITRSMQSLAKIASEKIEAEIVTTASEESQKIRKKQPGSELLNIKSNLYIGQILYLAKNMECSITDLVDNKIHTQIKHEIRAVRDAKSKNEVQIRFENRQFNVDEIGTQLFFKLDDYLCKGRDILNDPDYQLYLAIISNQLLSKDQEKIKYIKKYEPDNPMSEQEKQQIIDSYSDMSKQIEAEAAFKNTNNNGDYFSRLDIDTYFHDLDDWFDGHYYTKIYISEAPLGATKFLNKDTVIWQLNAGLYQEKQAAMIGDDSFKMRASRNSYCDSGIVVSWKSPIADLYYNNEINNLKIGGKFVYEHDLILKRRFSNHEKDFNDLFVLGNSLFEEGSVDPFLLNVLNENKSKHELCDIIRTIQSNQNTIIRRPLHENLVVQGCAGSGKTMILLHRLSYLLYNNPSLDMSAIKVLTPNELFNLHINELSETLELNNIERLTIEKYYTRLLNRLNPDWVLTNEFQSEAVADQSYVNYVYSDQFVADMENEYHNWLDNISESIKAAELKMISNKYQLSIAFPDAILSRNDIVRYRNTVNKMHTQLKEISGIANNILYSEQKRKELSSTLINKIDELKNKLNAQDKVLNADANQNAIQNCTELYVEVNSLSAKLEMVLDSLYKLFTRDLAKNIKELADDINMVADRIDWLAAKVLKTTNEQINEIARDIRRHAQSMRKLIPAADMMQKIENANAIIKTVRNEDITSVAYARKKLNDITAKYAFEEIMANIIKPGFPNQKQDLNGTYRFRLYAQLLFYWLYYGIPAKADQMLLIDEGQDLAVNEYRLLDKVNGGKVIFNVFGDTNQLIKLGRGIQDWNALRSTFDMNMFSINENYRNTNEITVYCNQQFDLNALPIGLSGKQVTFMSKEQMINSLSDPQDDDLRVAIILIQKAQKVILQQLSKGNIPFKFGEIEPGMITVIDVEKAKGLEFDIVYVFPENMSKNEKYIAFTRALSELIVVG